MKQWSRGDPEEEVIPLKYKVQGDGREECEHRQENTGPTYECTIGL